MSIVLKCRHTGYIRSGTRKGMPIVREMPSDSCSTILGDFYGLRHFGYTADGTPKFMSALKCCDELSPCPKVEEGCLAQGISQKVIAKSYEVENCQSSRKKTLTLYYCKPYCYASIFLNNASAGSTAWENLLVVEDSDDTYITNTMAAGQTTNYLISDGPCCEVPPLSNPVRFIKVEIEAHASGTGVVDLEVKLTKNGSIVSTNQATGTALPLTDGIITYNFSNAVWGVSYSAGDIYGVALRYSNTSGAEKTVFIDNIKITLEMCPDPALTTLIPPFPPASICTPCDPDEGRWYGNLPLRVGSLDFEMCCFDDGAGLQFKLIWRGCDYGCTDIFPDCEDPLLLNFGNITVNDCCDCLNSTESGTLNLYAVSNCKQAIVARHVGYAGGMPVVARESSCIYDTEGCGCTPHCGLVMTITDDEDCACLTGTYDLDFLTSGVDSGLWEQLSVGACEAIGIVHMTCEVNYDEEGFPDGTVTLTLDIQCGATNTGSDSVVVSCEDLEDLDVTFEIEMTDPSVGGCTGDCNYTWNSMTMGWQYASDDCFIEGAGSCGCPDGVTVTANYPPGTFEAEPLTIPCEGDDAPTCCIGFISVRVMR
jgi:hypothetical protein